MLSVINDVRALFPLKKIVSALQDADAMKDLVNEAGSVMTASYMETMPPLLTEVLLDAGTSAGVSAKVHGSYRTAAVTLAFDRTNPEALGWAERHSAVQVTNVTLETQLAIRYVIAQSFQQQYTVLQAARLLRNVVGLTEPHARAVANAYRRLLEADGETILLGKTRVRVPVGGLSRAKLDEATKKYATRLRNYRTRMIARTETMAASNQGQRELWNQAIRQGLLTGKEYKEWIYTPDEQRCPICSAMAGVQVPLGKQFELPTGASVDGPPAHPQCRCSEGITRLKVKD